MEDARAARLKPPYRILLITDINEIKMMAIQHDEQILDGHRAITVYQDQLQDLNDCINFIEDYVI